MEKFYAPDFRTKEGFFEIQGALRWGNGSERHTIKVFSEGIYDGWRSWRFGKDAFRSPEEAATKAQELRMNKIASLRKQIDKLEALGN